MTGSALSGVKVVIGDDGTPVAATDLDRLITLFEWRLLPVVAKQQAYNLLSYGQRNCNEQIELFRREWIEMNDSTRKRTRSAAGAIS